jgi:hypothetical protein
MDRKEPCWAPRIIFTLLFAFACVGIAAFAPQNKFGHVSKLPDALLHPMVYPKGFQISAAINIRLTRAFAHALVMPEPLRRSKSDPVTM